MKIYIYNQYGHLTPLLANLQAICSLMYRRYRSTYGTTYRSTYGTVLAGTVGTVPSMHLKVPWYLRYRR
ncbi:MAG: hypothetical protein MKZ95_05960 [Pirellulales bacterium]|nr:hypothetical protein [Pirellulales bacterium]